MSTTQCRLLIVRQQSVLPFNRSYNYCIGMVFRAIAQPSKGHTSGLYTVRVMFGASLCDAQRPTCDIQRYVHSALHKELHYEMHNASPSDIQRFIMRYAALHYVTTAFHCAMCSTLPSDMRRFMMRCVISDIQRFVMRCTVPHMRYRAFHYEAQQKSCHHK